MTTNEIVNPNADNDNALTCPHCRQPLTPEVYTTWNGKTRVSYTCKTPTCELKERITATEEEWRAMSAERIASYYTMGSSDANIARQAALS